MTNYHRAYCRDCGFDTIAHRGRCFAGHKVSALADEVHIKTRRCASRKHKTDNASLFVDEGAADRPRGIE